MIPEANLRKDLFAVNRDRAKKKKQNKTANFKRNIYGDC